MKKHPRLSQSLPRRASVAATRTRAARMALLLGCMAVLTACGGGGGGGSPADSAQNVPLTPANYTAPGLAAATMVLDAGSASSALDLLHTGAPPAMPVGVGLRPLVQWMLARPLPPAPTAGSSPTERPNESVSEACTYGGSINASVNDLDSNGILDGNDTVSLSFANCVLMSGMAPVSGSISVQLNAVVSSGGSVTSGSLSMSFNALGSGGNTITGGALLTVSSGGNRQDLQFNDVRVTQGNRTQRYSTLVSYDFSGVSTLVTISGSVVFDGAAYTLATTTPLAMGATYPASGTLQVRDASGNRVDLVAGPAEFSLELYLSGDGVRDALSSHGWSTVSGIGI